MSIADRIAAAEAAAAKKTAKKKAAVKKTTARKAPAKKKRSSRPSARRPHRLTIDLSDAHARTLRSVARRERVAVADIVRGVADILESGSSTASTIVSAAIAEATTSADEPTPPTEKPLDP